MPATGSGENGVRTSKRDEMASMLKSCFYGLLGQEVLRDARINFEVIGIVQQDLATLEVAFTDEEIWQVIKELPSDKSPGPDELTGAFFKTAWPVIKIDVMCAINAFYWVDRRQFHCLNGAYLTLTPKMPNAAAPQDYRPISLIHSSPIIDLEASG
jgi:hypothetical protein